MSAWPNDGKMLAQFRHWLDQTRVEADSVADEELPETESAEAGPIGLSRFVEEFTALRHELKLQTKSSRTLAERTETTLKTMQEAIETFRSVEAKESQAAQGAAKPLVESLLELDDALHRGRTVIDAARRHILEDLTGELQEQLDDLFQRQSLWRRWICRRWHRAARKILLQRTALIHRDIFDSLVEGYGLILKRLDRAMERDGIYRIQCVGKPVDPNAMTVVEAVVDPLRPPGIVVEEVRPGYYWKDKVIRFAEVRAVQGRIDWPQ